MNRGNMQVNKMHKEDGEPGQGGRTGTFVSASGGRADGCGEGGIPTRTQCEIFTMPKHATMKDYRMATGFEALMGYLYLTEQFDRMAELLGKGLEQMGELAEAEGTSTDSHALQEAENEK